MSLIYYFYSKLLNLNPLKRRELETEPSEDWEAEVEQLKDRIKRLTKSNLSLEKDLSTAELSKG